MLGVWKINRHSSNRPRHRRQRIRHAHQKFLCEGIQSDDAEESLAVDEEQILCGDDDDLDKHYLFVTFIDTTVYLMRNGVNPEIMLDFLGFELGICCSHVGTVSNIQLIAYENLRNRTSVSIVRIRPCSAQLLEGLSPWEQLKL